jgi:gliding motility-associated-like protein
MSFFYAHAQNSTCSNALPFCTGTQYSFPAGVNAGTAEVGPNYGCLSSRPNPAWYFMQVETPGNIDIRISGQNGGVNTNDIDFICYGPFSSLSGICSNLTSSNTIDCSYAGGSVSETANIPNAQAGQFYILLITNFSNTACNINFSQTGGSGGTNCGILSSAQNNGPLCIGDTLLLTTDVDTSAFTFAWSGPNGFTSTQPEPAIFNVTSAMAGVYTLIVSDLNESDTSTTTVEVIPPPYGGFSASGLPCPGATLTFRPDSVYTGATYLWTLPSGSTFTTNPLVIQNANSTLNAGITLKITRNGCPGLPVTIGDFVNDTVRPVVLGNLHYCFEDSTYLYVPGSGYQSYLWSPNGETTDSVLVGAGSYFVTVVDTNGCTPQNSATIFVTKSSPSADITGLQRFCLGDSIALVASDGPPDYPYTYVWTQGQDTLSISQTLQHKGGDIVLNVLDSEGCRDTVFISAPATNPPNGSFTSNPATQQALVNTPFTFTNTSTAVPFDQIVGYQWYFIPPGDSANTENSTYTWFAPDTGSKQVILIVTSQLGCKDTVILDLYILDQPFVPNVFNPESEVAANKFFKVPYIQQYANNNVVIYNRWGKKVYEADNYNNDWDGDNLPSGTYFYVVSAPTLDKALKGTITLFRN